MSPEDDGLEEVRSRSESLRAGVHVAGGLRRVARGVGLAAASFVAMQQRPVGATGLKVSRLGLGTMTWGRDTDEHEARDQLDRLRGGRRHARSTPRPATATARPRS